MQLVVHLIDGRLRWRCIWMLALLSSAALACHSSDRHIRHIRTCSVADAAHQQLLYRAFFVTAFLCRRWSVGAGQRSGGERLQIKAGQRRAGAGQHRQCQDWTREQNNQSNHVPTVDRTAGVTPAIVVHTSRAYGNTLEEVKMY